VKPEGRKEGCRRIGGVASVGRKSQARKENGDEGAQRAHREAKKRRKAAR